VEVQAGLIWPLAPIRMCAPMNIRPD